MGQTNGASVVSITAIKAKPGDCINDATMTEVVRRMRATVDVNAIQQTFPVVQSPTPPQNKQVLWQPTDPGTNVPVGGLQVYDTATGTWQPQYQSQPPAAQAEVRSGYLLLTADGVRNISFTPAMPSRDYFVSLTLTSYDGTSYSLALPAANDAVHTYVVSKELNSISVHALKVPAGGIGIFWRIQQ